MSDSRRPEARAEREVRSYRDFLRRLRSHARGGSEPEAGARPDERYNFALESLQAIAVDIDVDGRIAYVSPTVTDILGYEPEELVGKRARDLTHLPEDSAPDEPVRDLLSGDTAGRNVFCTRHKDGSLRWLETSTGWSDRSEDGAPYTAVLARDVTERTEATQALLASEDRFRALTEDSPDIITEVDSDGRIRYLSPSFAAVLGREVSELEGKLLSETNIFASIHPDDIADLADRFRRGLGAGAPVGSLLAYRFRDADGSWRWFESRTTPYVTKAGETREVVLSRDVTERIQAEAELHASEERYRILAAASRDMIAEMDETGQILWVSKKAEEMLGYPTDSMIGRTGFFLIHPDDLDRVANVFLSILKGDGAIYGEPYRVRHNDGSWRWVEGIGMTFHRADGELRILGVTHDITERIEAEQSRRELEGRMQQAQKLEGLGVMAGGIAHDFNNLLTPILGDASLALMELPADSPIRTRIEKIRKTAMQAAALTKQMLAYAGSATVASRPVDLSRVVLEMAQLLETSSSSKKAINYRLDPNLPLVLADETQIGQVVMNLLTNAVEAVESDDGEITIETGTVALERGESVDTVLDGPLPEGRYVFLEVRDPGVGMDAETRSRIFDPFYTTKFTGRGLGLAAVLGIVRGHAGAIEIDSEPGHGTRFRVFFPYAEEQGEECAPEPQGAGDWRGTGTVLVVDDDEGVRDLTRESLARAGLTVLCATNGREGIDMFREHQREIRLIFLDLTMPDISGEQALAEIRTIDPDARVILVSGYAEECAVEHFAANNLAGFLQKPYLPESLIDKVREALES